MNCLLEKLSTLISRKNDESTSFEYCTSILGNLILPPFGYCELYELGKDVSFKCICELSQNVIYQYCLIVLWFALVLGIAISSLKLLSTIVSYALDTFLIKRLVSISFGHISLTVLNFQ